MKHLLSATGLCLALHLSAQDAPAPDNSTTGVSEPRPAYRYLFVVDTSSTMSRQKSITIDTVSKLILSSVGGRIRPGDAWGIWTFDDQLHTNFFPAQKWDGPQRRDVANRVFRLLRDQPLKKKKRHLDKVLAAIKEEAKNSDDLTVFLFTDGAEPVKGTPFDNSINGILSKNATGMRKAKKPFVIVFVAQDGRLAADGVSPGGEPIFVPRLAKKTGNPPNAAAAAAGSGTKPNAPATAPAPPEKRSLSVEEISRALRESQSKQTNATSPPPPGSLILRGTASAPSGSAKTNAETSAPVPNGDPPPRDATLPSPATVAGNVSTGESVSVPAKTTPTPPPQPARDAVATVNPAEEKIQKPPEVMSSASPQTAAVLQPEPASTGWKYLLAAGVLLFVALASAWLYIRSIRYVPRPSLISQSLNKEKK